jgi:GNAT superfamily N-acetyltransferase
MMLVLRPLRPDELPVAHTLCLRSKAYWGYDAAFMAACREELRLTPEDLAADEVIAAADDAGLAGLAQVSVDVPNSYLEKLFVAPERMGLGLGRILYDWALSAAGRLGATRLIIEADPDAAGFYQRMGAEPAGTAPSGSIEGRILPRLAHRICP